jgi:hypothetical protein
MTSITYTLAGPVSRVGLSGSESALQALRLPAGVCVPRRLLRRGAPRFLVLYHGTMCYDPHASIAPRCEPQVTHAPCTSVRPCVLDNRAILPARPTAYVELWHVYRWDRLCQYCA